MLLPFAKRGISASVAALLVAALVLGPMHVPLRAQARGIEPPYFAVRGARIVTVSGPVIEGGTVVIANGLISAVGKDVAIPPEAWVIDGKGLTVYPGLMDSLTDVALQAPPSGAPGGGGPGAQSPPSRGPEDRPATQPWRDAADELNAADKRIETWRNAGFTTLLVTPKNGIFPGEGAIADLAGERPGEMVVQAPADLLVTTQQPGGFFGFPGSLLGVLAYIKQVFLDTSQSQHAISVYNAHPQGLQRPAYDRTTHAINDLLRANRVVLFPAMSKVQILRALEMNQQLKTHMVIYGAHQGYAAADVLAAQKMPVLVSLKWPEKEKDADPEEEEPLRVLQLRDRAPSTPAAFEKAGVKFAFYSDGVAAPKDVLKNVKKALDAGLKPEAALRALTLSAAEIFGVADRLGSIEPGKIANLVVADGDLFNEKTKVKMVFVDGRRYESREPERPTDPPTGTMAGKWKFSVTTPEGTQEATADISMTPDGTVTGTVVSHMGTSSISSGWLSGTKFRFTISLPLGPGPVDVTFNGTLEGDTAKGTVTTMGESYEFTATRPGSSGASRTDAGGAR